MINSVQLTDDELSVIMTALHVTLTGTEKYIEVNGTDSLDITSSEAYKDMKKLYERLESEYY